MPPWQRAFGSLVPNIAANSRRIFPLAAGLGGGSADAAATLRALCRLASLDPLSRQCTRSRCRLGADVPVCLHSRASPLRGIGEADRADADFLACFTSCWSMPERRSRRPRSYAGLGLEPGEPGYPPLESSLSLPHFAQ